MVYKCDVPVGVITGDNVVKLLKHAKENGYAIPAFNCTRYVRRFSLNPVMG
jgi:fructose-bisphosphate aldolase class II